MSFVCFVTNLVIIIFLTLLSETIQEKRKIVTVFVGSCLVSVHSIPSRTVYTERTYSHPQSGSGACGLLKEEDLVVHKIPREWVLLENFKFVNDE